MIEEYAKVVRVGDACVWVETTGDSGCGQCSSKTSCTQSMLGKWLKPKETALRLENTSLDLQPGDLVLLGIHEQALLKGSALVYLLPILLTFLAALAGKWIVSFFASLSAHSELFISIFGVAGLLLSIRLARHYSTSPASVTGGLPVIIRKVSYPLV